MTHAPTDAQELLEHLRVVEDNCQNIRAIWASFDEQDHPNTKNAFTDLQILMAARLAIMDLLRVAAAPIEIPDVPEDDRKWGITDFNYASTLGGYFPVETP